MGFFSATESDVRYGVVIDIGSGSVLAAIVKSDKNNTYPDIIWSNREYTPLRNANTLNRSAKSIMTSLVNVLMTLDSEGRKVLREQAPSAKITTMQVTIAAPWSYTVAKTISYNNEEEFIVNQSFLEELLRMARQKVLEDLKENEKIHQLGLSVVSRITADVLVNGYSVKVTGKQKTKAIKVMELTSIAHESIVNEVIELQQKMFSATDLYQYSFMMSFFYTILNFYPDVAECCLVDVTYEATEIGIVREGILQYCTHTPYGAISLAREISSILSVTMEEAHNYLYELDFDIVLEKYSDRQKKDIEQLFLAYQKRLVELFHETGDKLSIPKIIFLHSDLLTAPFFKKQILIAIKEVTGSSHVVYNVTSDILTKHYPQVIQDEIKNSKKDTAMLISAQFFHTHNYQREFEQL